MYLTLSPTLVILILHKIDTILDIGSYLSKYDSLYLYEYLYERFEIFINKSTEKEYDWSINDLIQKLSEVCCEEGGDIWLTKKDKLFQLFSISNYSINDEFERAINYHSKINEQ
jgi:hypothetical protein